MDMFQYNLARVVLYDMESEQLDDLPDEVELTSVLEGIFDSPSESGSPGLTLIRDCKNKRKESSVFNISDEIDLIYLKVEMGLVLQDGVCNIYELRITDGGHYTSRNGEEWVSHSSWKVAMSAIARQIRDDLAGWGFTEYTTGGEILRNSILPD
jgi:hypothetical protein